MHPPFRAGSTRPSPALRVALLVVTLAGWLGLAGQIVGPLVAPPVRAATPDLTVVTSATYDVQPDRRRIHVSMELTARNNLVDTPTTQHYYDQAYLAVQPEATGFVVSGGLAKPTVDVSESKPTYKLLRISFGAHLAAKASTTVKLAFDLPDAGSPLDRQFRVTPTLVTFPVWVYASTATPGSRVRVIVPSGYQVAFLRGTLPGPVSDGSGRQIWTSAPVADPLKFDVFIRADHPPRFVETSRTVKVGDTSARFIFRSWSDDPAWLARIGDLFDAGIPRLSAAIGQPWPMTDPLVVQEVVSPVTAGIAGTFDPVKKQIEVVYSAGPEVALHEAAHVWFNGGLLEDRWANEAFASYYAETVADGLGLPFQEAVVTPELRTSAVPLNDWAAGNAEPPAGADQSAVEAYGYAAAAELARRIGDRVGDAGLRSLWAAIVAGTAPYQPPGGPTVYLAGQPDWRGLLDLLEADGTTQVADLWSALVTTPAQTPTLDDRANARRAYSEMLARAGDWRLPGSIGDALRGWKFDVATAQLALARTILDERDALSAGAAAAGLVVPASLRAAFESAADLTPVEARFRAEAKAAAAIAAASAARPATIGPVEWIGLVGSAPDRQLADATRSFEAGDGSVAAAAAASAEATWRGVGDAGRIRLVLLGVALLFAVVVAGAVIDRRIRGMSA